MKSSLLFQVNVSLLDQKTNRADTDTDGAAQELYQLLQAHRQDLDIRLDEAVEGLQGAQQVLNVLKEACFSVPTVDLTPAARLKVQRASHHCTRLITEIMQHLQPLSQELQELLLQETSSTSSQVRTARRS